MSLSWLQRRYVKDEFVSQEVLWHVALLWTYLQLQVGSHQVLARNVLDTSEEIAILIAHHCLFFLLQCYQTPILALNPV